MTFIITNIIINISIITISLLLFQDNIITLLT
jgi:hypothetical protein